MNASALQSPPDVTLDVEAALALLAQLRALHQEMRAISPDSARNEENERRTDEAMQHALATCAGAGTIQAFELETLSAVLGDLVHEMEVAREQATARAVEDCLEIYYKMEELALDPANAELLPSLETMRQAYLEDFGTPIPPRVERLSA
jgi:hypothetical protein